MNNIRTKLLSTFQVEHREHIERIRAILVQWEKTGKAGTELEEAFRRAHSLKGAARAVDLGAIEQLAHRLETLFVRLREGVLNLDAQVAAVIRQVLDATEDVVASLSGDSAPPGPAVALQGIERLLGIESEVPVEVDPEAKQADVAGRSFQPVETVRIRLVSLDRLLRTAGQLQVEVARQDIVKRALEQVSRQTSELEKDWDRLRKVSFDLQRGKAAEPMPGKVSRRAEQIDRRLRALGRDTRSLVLFQRGCVWDLHRLGEQLQEDVREVRMVPAETVFEGFRKMVRDLARDEKKEMDLQIEGLEVEADRLVLQELKDPLMHLLRNAVNHGIELPAERARKGKTRSGAIWWRLESHRHRLWATVEDDGQGIDLKHVTEIAVQKGLLSEAEAAASSPESLRRLLFRPGFSTSPSVSHLAGRGMGLSVVYETVKRLQGEVEVSPRDGGGTSVLVSVPLTLSAARLLLVTCQARILAIPAHNIERLCRLTASEVETVEGKPVVRLNGQTIPLVSLPYVMGIGEPKFNLDGKFLHVALVASGQRRAAFAVDGFVAERQAIIQDLGRVFGGLRRIAGTILMEDGSVALVLNPLELLDSLEQSMPVHTMQPVEVSEAQKTPIILVVDDSITTRSLEKSILEAHGYDVRVAIDGLEALQVLRSEAIDLVIADLQMPRMDGFALLAEMKADPHLAAIPVIVVTSMERVEDQERGLTLGADAYIVKKKFEQRELLDTIRQIL